MGIVTSNYLSGRFTAHAPLALATVWLIAAIWGYTDWWLRRTCRGKTRNESASSDALGNSHANSVDRG